MLDGEEKTREDPEDEQAEVPGVRELEGWKVALGEGALPCL